MHLRTTVPAAAAALVLLLAGCSSELPNEVGADLATVEVDSVLVPLDVRALADYSALEVTDPDLPFSARQTLWLGAQAGTRSSILLNFDFDYLQGEDFPSELFEIDSLRIVSLSLTRLTYYARKRFDPINEDSIPVPEQSFRIYTLDAPFDTTAYPGPVPAHSLQPVNTDFDLSNAGEPRIRLSRTDFLSWVDEGGVRGFLIEVGVDSDSTLVGYAARDLRRYSQIPPVAQGTIPGPNLILEFRDETVNPLVPCIADVSTFDEVPPPPAAPDDHILVRTGLRRYPALLFDLAKLPRDVYVNRAVLVLHNDTSRGFGPAQTLVVSELDAGLFGDPYATLTLDELGAAVYPVTGTFSNVPEYNVRFDFNVTTSVQRLVNGAYTGTRGFLLTADEDFLPAYDSFAYDPDFYYSEFRFHGFGAATDSLRPHLMINYSSVEDLGGAGDE